MSVALESLTVGYRGRAVATGLTATARSGELTALVGPNGAGKSTLLRTLCGLQRPLDGRAVLHDGTQVHSVRPAALARRISVVLTERPDPGLLTAFEVVMLGRTPHLGRLGVTSDEDVSRVVESLAAVSATELSQRRFDQLSDGERQRVLVARALAQEPELLVLDEPTAHLDAPSRVEFLDLLRQLARSQHIAVLLSSHDLELAMRVANQMWLLERGGRFSAGSPTELAVAGAIGKAFNRGRLRFDVAEFAFHIDEALESEAGSR